MQTRSAQSAAVRSPTSRSGRTSSWRTRSRPSEVEFLGISDTRCTAVWRPQEALAPFIIDQAVRQVSSFAAASRWLAREPDGAQARGELVVVFGHHPIRNLNADVADELAPQCPVDDLHGHDANPGCDRDPRESQPLHFGPDLEALLLEHPHVIAYVAGHTHENEVTPFAAPGGGGFWGIGTASEIDWPVQSRLIGVMGNRNGTLSIFGTVVDRSGSIATPPAGTPASLMTPATLASIGREMSFNDPQSGGDDWHRRPGGPQRGASAARPALSRSGFPACGVSASSTRREASRRRTRAAHRSRSRYRRA